MKGTMEKREARAAWVMMAPALIVIAVVAIWPVMNTFYMSMHEMVLTKPQDGQPFVFLDHYIKFFQNTEALGALGFTFLFTVTSVFLELILGMVIAVLMNKTFKGRGLFRATMLVPWAVPTSVAALMMKFFFNDQYGVFNDVIVRLGLSDHYIAWLGTPGGAFFAVVFADVWKTSAYMGLLILAGLQMVPESMYESAKIDGAGVFTRFFKITIPVIKNTILVAMLFRTLDAFRAFDMIQVMTNGGPGGSTETMSMYAYTNLMSYMDFGYGSTVAVVTFVVIFLISMIYMKLMGNKLTDVD